MENDEPSVSLTPGAKFRHALTEESPLQIMGTINAYAAVMAADVGYRAIYLSGGGVAAASYGLPDLGITSLNDVLEDARRITAATNVPLLVDIDTGWGGAFNIAKTIREMIRAQVAAVHLEDQMTHNKRCGHRPQKAIVSTDEMVDRIKAAVDARTDDQFVIMARTDALASEGLSAAIDRAMAYVDAGADMVFPEAITDLESYQAFTQVLNVPILANITEFGKTPLFTCEQLASVGVRMVLYPLSAFRAMNAAALTVFEQVRAQGTQRELLPVMQTREALYERLGYHAYEQKLDELYREGKL